MKSAEYVAKQVEALKKSEKTLWLVVWKVALLCVGWAYVFGARGALCTPANRKASYNSHGADHPTIKTKCQYLQSGKACTGCKWYPGNERTRYFDCRGFVYWVIYIVTGWKLQGAGSNSQWNTKSNWKSKGEIKTCPSDTLVLLFQYKGGKMIHVGFGYGNETCECQVGVQYKTKRESKWTHWAIPICFDDSYKIPAEKPKEDKVSEPVLKKGASGSKVKELQKLLIDKGYSCGKKGADGKFGDDTLAAVKAFQKAQGLKVDGIVGQDTWKALKSAEKPQEQLYRVIIPGQTEKAANDLINAHKGAYKEKEG